MKHEDAAHLVRADYSAHGRTAPEGAVIELADELVHSSCGSCAAKAFEDNRNNVRGPLTVPTFRASMIALRNSTLHMDHVGHSESDVQGGQLEAFWRGPASDAIASRLQIDHQTAQIIASELWIQQHDFTWHHNAAQAAEDCVDTYGSKESAATFVRATVDRITRDGGPTREMVERSFDRARRAFHAGGVDNLWNEAAS